MQDFLNFITHHLVLVYGLAAALLLLGFIEMLRYKHMTYSIDTKQAVQLINRQHAVIVDIRPEDQYKTKHIVEAKNIAAADLLKQPKQLEKWKSKPIIFVCQAGVQSQKIAASLLKQGYNVFSLSGGLRAWAEAGLPLNKEK